MSAPVLQNFRGARALILHGPDGNRDKLESILRRFGLLVGCIDPADRDAAGGGVIETCDILFYDADQGTGDILPEPIGDRPTIALIGVEAPSRLSRVARMRTTTVLTKPIRSTGVFAALFMAFNEHESRRRDTEVRRSLEDRLRGRRFVVKAIIQIMNEKGVDDDEAFRLLRRESMRRRMTIEEFSRLLLAEWDRRDDAKVV